jgi:hypothetical protein
MDRLLNPFPLTMEEKMNRIFLKRLSIIAIILLLILLIKSPWFDSLLNIEQEDVKELREKMGYQLLLLTIPLGIFQGVVTICLSQVIVGTFPK